MNGGLMAWAGLGLFFVGLRLLGSQVQVSMPLATVAVHGALE